MKIVKVKIGRLPKAQENAATKSRLVFVWRLIGLEHGMIFLDQSQTEVKQSRITFDA